MLTLYRFVRHDLLLFMRNRGVLLSILALIILSIIAQGAVVVRRHSGPPEESRLLVGRPDADKELARVFAPAQRIRPPRVAAHPVLDLLSPERGGSLTPLEDLSLARLLQFLLPIIGLIIGIVGQNSSKRIFLHLRALPCRSVYSIISRILSSAIMAAIMVLALHLTTITIFAFVPGGLHHEVMERLLYFYAIAFSYTFFFVALGIALDLIFARATAALTGGLVIVILMVFVLPQIAAAAGINAGSPMVFTRFLPSYISEQALFATSSIHHSTARYYREIERVNFVPPKDEFPIRKVLSLLIMDLGILLLWAGAASGIGIGLFMLRRRYG